MTRTTTLSLGGAVALSIVACGSSGSGGLGPGSQDAGKGGDARAPHPDAGIGHGRDSSAPRDSGAPRRDASSPDSGTLASRYPCDKGIESDPSFVWGENFEEGSLSAFASRYDQVDNTPGMAFVSDVPVKSCGGHAMSLTAGGSVSATDFYKKLPNANELYVRWYAKYEAMVPWHHTGVWFGGYDPPQSYPSPHAGIKPAGNDRFELAIEPIWGVGSPNPDFDFYNYWMQMHTCSSCDGDYWGNALISKTSFTADDDTWVCVETHAVVNSDLGSTKGAVLEVWKNDVLVQAFPETGGVGFWVQDHYCPVGANGSQCAYSPTAPGPLDLQLRSTASLQLNYFWPQNYITSTQTGTVEYDDMVVATSRIGCLE